jgi:UDP-glucose 4-epimerase
VILVTGGAGYIGSHVVHRLRETKADAVVVDDLSHGHRSSVPDDVPFHAVDVSNRDAMRDVLRRYGITSIMHFASRIEVGESMRDPLKHYAGNLGAAIALLEVALEAGVRRFVLSSTAAVYGTPRKVPIAEDHPTVPMNPYGETKLAIERMLHWYSRAYGLRYATLRYFNAAGALPGSDLAERHEPETHLIPLVLEAAAGLRPQVTVYGTSYDTPDGTCIRDYVHVCDLADAHALALSSLEASPANLTLNLGCGKGHSVQEVISTVERVTGRKVPVEHGPPRAGDPAVLVADPSLAEETLGFIARRSSLERIITDAWSTFRTRM